MMEKGCKYEGDWVQGIREGSGKWITDNGDVYEGDFAQGLMSGKGNYQWYNGNHYVGMFRNGKPHGRGIFTFADTLEKIDGEFVDGRPFGGNNSGGRQIDKTQEVPSHKLTGKDRWKQVQKKLLPVAVNKVQTPFLGQHGDSLF